VDFQEGELTMHFRSWPTYNGICETYPLADTNRSRATIQSVMLL